MRAPRDDSSPSLLAAPCDDPPPVLWLPHRKPLAAICRRFVWLCHRASLVQRCHSFGQCTSPLLRAIAIFCIRFQAQACAALAQSHPSITPTGDRNLPSRRRASSHQSSRRRAIIDIHGDDGRPLQPRQRAPSTSRPLPISPSSAWAIPASGCTLPFASRTKTIRCLSASLHLIVASCAKSPHNHIIGHCRPQPHPSWTFL